MKSLENESMPGVLANYVCNLSISDLPDEIIERAQISIIDAMGCAFAGHKLPTPQIALNLFDKLSSHGESTLWLNGKKADLLNTAWVNCILVHSGMHDDMQSSTFGHMGSMIIPTAFAVAEMGNKTGAELICAVVGAYEVAGRIASRSGLRIVNRGFRGSPIFGTLASATAAGKLLGLNEKELQNAICCAASFSCGTLEPCNKGTMEWHFQNGNALWGGIMAALLASQGIDSSNTALEGECGFFAAFGGKDLSIEINENMTSILASLGKEFEISKNIFKPFATCGHNQVGVDIVVELMKKNKIRPENIRMVKIEVSSDNKAYPGVTGQGPFTSLEKALLSKPFSIAAAIKHGNLQIDTYLEHLGDGDILELSKKVFIDVDPGISVGSLECVVTLLLNDGRKLSGNAGSVDMRNYRLDKRSALEKFEKMSSPVLNKDRAAKIGEYIFQLHQMPYLSELSELFSTR
jgi:2-methylcitrate dehydratase PrpD